MPAPLYKKIAADLRRQIDARTLRPGDRLPSTRELMATYGVSETVIRFVMVELKAEQRVHGIPGKGVYVGPGPQ